MRDRIELIKVEEAVAVRHQVHLKREAASRSSLNSFWNTLEGKVFHAIVSVTAVKIQCNSPRGVFRSE